LGEMYACWKLAPCLEARGWGVNPPNKHKPPKYQTFLARGHDRAIREAAIAVAIGGWTSAAEAQSVCHCWCQERRAIMGFVLLMRKFIVAT